MRNILLITMDQLRHDTLGFRGCFPVRTPNLDRLAAEGTVFAAAYTPSPICVPARAALMTGLLPCDTGVYYNDGFWADALPTLPGLLSNNGYYTLAVGKMHFRPNRRYGGFDKRCADNDTDYPLYLARNGISPHPPYGSMQEMCNHAFTTQPTHLPLDHYLETYITDRTLAELDRIVQRRDCRPGGNEPFFLWQSFVLPHTPCNPPEPWFSMYDPADLPPPVRDERELAAFAPEMLRWRDSWAFLDDAWTRKIRAQYLGCVSLVDELIGRTLDRLRELDLLEHTLVVFTTDHGDYLGDHFMMQKGFFHDCAAKVPLILHGPDIPAGRSVSEPCSLIDLLPTLLDYCDLAPARYDDATNTRQPLPGLTPDGASLLNAFRAPGLDPDRVVISETGIHGLAVMGRHRHMKAVYYDRSQRLDLFDLEQDPDELCNLGPGKALADLAAPLRDGIQEALRRSARFRGDSYYFKGKTRPLFT